MALISENIPDILKQQPNWVCWGIRDALPKSPYNPASLLEGKPRSARAGAKETWGDYETAVECVYRKLARGVGYEFDGSGICGVDLDHVIDKAGITAPEAQGIVGKLDSYTETSPSGVGLHILVIAPGIEITRHRKKDHFLEIYNEGRYFTVTGIIHGGKRTIEKRAAELQEIHDIYLASDAAQNFADISPTSANAGHGQFLRTGLERDKVFSALWGGERRYGNESSDDIALMNKLAYWCNADTNAMIQAFLTSPHYAQKGEGHKRKCQRSDYLPNTARNACATAHSTAVADYERWQQNIRKERGLVR